MLKKSNAPDKRAELKDQRIINYFGKRAKGFNLPVAIGNNTFDIKLSGEARLMIGLVCAVFNPITGKPDLSGDKFITLSINNDTVIDAVQVGYLNNNTQIGGQAMTEEVFIYIRTLNGQDNIQLKLNSDIAGYLIVKFVYL
jgi:hypothetical protein